MNRQLIATGILTLAFVGMGTAQNAVAAGEDDSHVKPAQLKRMAREAHTPEQYRTLADSYEAQQQDYLKQAADAKRQWIQLLPPTGNLNAKYPRPVDNAKSVYEHYLEKASEAGALSAKYAQLADPGGATTQQRM